MINFILNLFGKNNDSRFYYLSLLYENNKWSIHGLWPQNSKDSYPTYCKLVNFDEIDIKKINSKEEENKNKSYSFEIRTKISTNFKEINEKYLKKLGSYGLLNRINIIKNLETTIN